jgi:hypothetical protein
MEGSPADKRQFVVVDDYGSGGIWGLITAESADAITRRYPRLRVVTIGDPTWVTPQKYSEIVSDWIKPSEHFDIDHPTGCWQTGTHDSPPQAPAPPERPSPRSRLWGVLTIASR